MKRHALWAVGLLLTLVVVVGSAAHERAGEQIKPQREDYSSGPYLYRVFCASCHGQTGMGDGPVADLVRPRPADLTTIAARHGGKFPRDDVSAIIAGRKPIPGHGASEMPAWIDIVRSASTRQPERGEGPAGAQTTASPSSDR